MTEKLVVIYPTSARTAVRSRVSGGNRYRASASGPETYSTFSTPHFFKKGVIVSVRKRTAQKLARFPHGIGRLSRIVERKHHARTVDNAVPLRFQRIPRIVQFVQFVFRYLSALVEGDLMFFQHDGGKFAGNADIYRFRRIFRAETHLFETSSQNALQLGSVEKFAFGKSRIVLARKSFDHKGIVESVLHRRRRNARRADVDDRYRILLHTFFSRIVGRSQALWLVQVAFISPSSVLTTRISFVLFT